MLVIIFAILIVTAASACKSSQNVEQDTYGK